MGWKLAIAATPLHGRTLAEAVSQLYGTPRQLVACPETIDSALYPADQSIAYAAAISAHALLFDWPLVLDVLDNGFSGSADAQFYLLQSTTNLYGFAKYQSGRELRRRGGSADDGLYVNAGTPFDTERGALATLCRPDQKAQAWAAWNDPALTFDADDGETYTHDTVGEEIVFAIMASDLGFRLDMDVPGYEDIFDRPVLRVVSPASAPSPRKWWQRKLR